MIVGGRGRSAPAGRGRLPIIGLMAGLAVASALALGPADSARAAPVRFLAPHAGKIVTSGAVRVKIKARRPLRGFEAWVDSRRKGGTDVTGRFRSVGGGVRRARLRVDRQLGQGRHELYVRARTRSGGTRTAVRSFNVATRRASLVAVRRPRIGTRRAPVAARVKLRRGRMRARLNGRNVRRAFEPGRKGRIQTARLTVHDGLRFGRNRLVVTAFTANGRYKRVRRTFKVSRRHPLADAGRDRTTRVGARLRLNGRRSRPARRRSKLRMRWRIVDRPEGSKPKLKRARRARPRLIADVEGHYTLRLRVRERRARGDRRGQRARGAAAGGIRAARVTPRTSDDVVTVAAQPNVLPQGVPVKTIAFDADTPGIELGGEFYPARGGGGPQLLVLDRETLAVNRGSSRTFPVGDSGVGQLNQALAALTSDQLAIVTGGGRNLGLDRSGIQELATAVGSIGAALRRFQTPAPEAEAAIESGQWSVVGIPGTSPGTAYQLLGREQGAFRVLPGGMSGFFQLDSNDDFTFTWAPEYLTFDTQAPGSTKTKNVISVNGKDHPSPNLELGQSGVQVLWLDADTLELRDTLTYLNRRPDSGECGSPGQPECLRDFVMKGGKLSEIAADPDSMLLINTILEPNVFQSSRGTLALLADGLKPFGANPQVVLAGVGIPEVTGLGNYSFVGVNGLGELGPNSGAEVNTGADAVEAPRLAGTFERNRQGLLVPAGYGSPGPGVEAEVAQQDLQRLLAQPDEPFPAFDTPAERAAERYIADRLDLRPDSKFGIRGLYWQDLNIDWGAQQSSLNALDPCAAPPCAQGFEAVKTQLAREFGMVATVLNYFTVNTGNTLLGVLEEAMFSSAVDFFGISSEIMSTYNPPPKPAQGRNALEIIEGSVTIASGVGEAIPVVGGAVAAPFTIASGAAEIVQGTTTKPGGNPTFDPTVFEQKIGSFAKVLNGGLRAALDNLDHVAVLLVSDWGRLQSATAKVNTPSDGPEHGWGLNSQSSSALGTVITLGLRRYMWSSLLPVPLTIYTLNTGKPSPCPLQICAPGPRSPNLFTPLVPTNTDKSDPSLPLQSWYMCKTNTQDDYPPSQILDSLFNLPTDRDDSGLGFYKGRFYAPAPSSGTPGWTHTSADHAWRDVGMYCNGLP